MGAGNDPTRRSSAATHFPSYPGRVSAAGRAAADDIRMALAAERVWRAYRT